MIVRIVAVAMLHVTSFSMPAFALKPTPEHQCCQRPDIRAGECARFDLTPDRCSEIRAAYSRADRERMVVPQQQREGRRKESEMHDAIEKNDVPRVRSLLAARRSDPPSFARLELRPMFLIRATRFGYETIVSELIAEGVDVNGGDADKKTALMHASEKGQRAFVNQLLKAGADVKLKSMWGDTALSLAKEGRHNDVITLLVHHGAK